ncbi:MULTISPECIES: FkbM family methyltransferase [Kordiimonas]|jgi:FkbM family methyltransferase|uniref:FkbM family methyltransferase n=1 Tax=Kordiimonas TaxID=288021 RepID=UPI00257D8A0B|nr:FkbM family methyltransferase [Kordiimonas sp. UBA4487]
MIIQQLHALSASQGQPVGHYFEAIVQKIYEDLLAEGDVAIDVGANNGRHMFPMAQAVGSKGRIVAFEPIPSLCKRLRKRARKHGFKNIQLHECAVAAEAGKASFSLFENRKAFSGLKRRSAPFSDEEGGLAEIAVNCCRLDSKMPWFRRVTLMKLDIEGGEYHALLGAERLVARDRPVIIFENGRHGASQLYGYTKDDFFSLFERHGYQLYVISGERFTRDLWHSPLKCWEFVAYPKEVANFASRLPSYCSDILRASVSG